MHVVVTGAAGAIGRYVVADLAARGHTISAVDRAAPGTADPGTGGTVGRAQARELVAAMDAPAPDPSRITWRIGDSRDEALMAAACAGADALIHLAAIPAPTLGTPLEVFATNTQGTFVALEQAGIAGVRRVVIASSISLLGIPWSPVPISPLYAPVDEAHPNIGSDPYALSKETDEATLRTMHRRHGYQAIALRISGTAPMGFHRHHAPSIVADPGVRKHELWAYLDSRDGARAFVLAVERDLPGHHVVNVMAPDTNSPLPSAELMARFHPSTPLRRPLVGRESIFDVTRCRELLGFVPAHRLIEEDPA